MQRRAYLTYEIAGRHIHHRVIQLRPAIVTNPRDVTIFIDENKRMPRFPGADCPLKNIIGFGNVLVCIYEHGRIRRDAKLWNRRLLLCGVVKGDANESGVKVNKLRVCLQINDLLKAGVSPDSHVEVKQHRLPFKVVQ